MSHTKALNDSFTQAFSEAVAALAQSSEQAALTAEVAAPETLDRRIEAILRQPPPRARWRGWRRGVTIAAAVLVVAVALNFVLYYNVSAYQHFIRQLYQPTTVRESLDEYERNGITSPLLEAVLLPASMGITIPHIDPAKIYVNTPLSEFPAILTETVMAHGYSRAEAEAMTYSEYRQLEDSWPIDPMSYDSIRHMYPELAQEDLSQWTNGQFEDYFIAKDQEALAERFTPEQRAELEARDIRIADTSYLFKEFHNPETILAQSDETLKAVLEAYYRINLEFSGVGE